MPIEKFCPTFTFTEDRLQQLAAVVPEAFADGKVNWETLKAALGAFLETSETTEQFGLFWPGKNAARQLAGTPIKKTLVPVPGEGINEADTHHIFIEGDNLEVLKLLHKSYIGKVKLIYIDPPYNTGNDFVYLDDYRESQKEYLTKTGDMNSTGDLLTTNYRENTKASGRFHSNWLNMMLPRLMLARMLLSEDGVIFVSIDDNEISNLRHIMGEIFGEENIIATIVWQKSKKGDAKLVAINHEYILVAAINKQKLIEDNKKWRIKKPGANEVLEYYDSLCCLELVKNHEDITEKKKAWYTSLSKKDPRRAHQHYCWSDERGLYFAADFAGPDDGRKSRPRYDIIHPVTGKSCKKPSTGWRWDEERTRQALSANPPLIHFGQDETTIPCRKSYLFEIDSEPFASVFYRDGRAGTLELENLLGKGLFDFPKDVKTLVDLIEISTKQDSLVIDFFAGSCTAAQAVLELNREDGGNRRFIMVQLPEPTPQDSTARKAGYKTIADIGKERILRVIKKLADSPQAELIAKRDTPEDLGFRVFKVAPSHFKTWQPYAGDDVAAVEQQQGDLLDAPLIDGWTSDGLRAEVLLQHGLPLDSPCETLSAAFPHNTVQCLTPTDAAHRLLVCFDNDLHSATVTALQTRLTLQDTLVCFDRAFADDNAKLHLAEVCQLRVI